MSSQRFWFFNGIYFSACLNKRVFCTVFREKQNINYGNFIQSLIKKCANRVQAIFWVEKMNGCCITCCVIYCGCCICLFNSLILSKKLIVIFWQSDIWFRLRISGQQHQFGSNGAPLDRAHVSAHFEDRTAYRSRNSSQCRTAQSSNLSFYLDPNSNPSKNRPKIKNRGNGFARG